MKQRHALSTDRLMLTNCCFSLPLPPLLPYADRCVSGEVLEPHRMKQRHGWTNNNHRTDV
jgi:hypothetical protein